MELNSQIIEDKNIQKKAWISSLAVYGVFLLVLFFIKIVYSPPQEVVAFGVDLNYGVDFKGSGDIQTTNKANASKNAYDVKPEAGPKAKVKETPISQKATPSAPQKSKTSKILTASEDTKVTVKKTPDNVKSTNNSSSTTNNTPAPVVKKPEPVVRSVDNSSIMKKSSGSGGSSGSNGTTGTRDGVGGNNNGDGKAGEVGDQGDPRGTPDGKSLYGNPGKGGSGSGASVSISGWKNKGNLNVSKDKSNDVGTIIFDVVINDNGDVVSIKNRPTSLSYSVINHYKEQIRTKLKSNLVAEGTPPSRSSGTITIRITRD